MLCVVVVVDEVLVVLETAEVSVFATVVDWAVEESEIEAIKAKSSSFNNWFTSKSWESCGSFFAKHVISCSFRGSGRYRCNN